MASIRTIVAHIILEYLRFFTKIQIWKIHPFIIGVGGSSGKSSLTELVGIVLQERYIVNTTKEKNSETGIPLHILGIHMAEFSYKAWIFAILLTPFRIMINWRKYDILVAEMGIDSPVEPKNMSYLLKIIRPTMGVITNISLEHTVYFDPFIKAGTEKERKEQLLAYTAKEELLLLQSLPENGNAILNIDDPMILNAVSTVSASKTSISLYDKSATLFASHIMIDISQFAMEFVYKNKEYILKLQHSLPQHFAYEFLFAIAIGVLKGISIEQSISSIEKHFSLPPGRMTIFEGIRDTTLIDSSYNNATLSPMLDMLDFLSKLGRHRRKVVIVGDMRELGSQSKENHEIVAEKIVREADIAILIGPLLQNYASPILRSKKFPFQSFSTFSAAKQYILECIKKDDIILIKSSQNTLFLERVVEMLLENKNDVAKLCRRGEFWDKKRMQTA